MSTKLIDDKTPSIITKPDERPKVPRGDHDDEYGTSGLKSYRELAIRGH